MKAYIYIVLLNRDFSLMPRGSTIFSSSQAALCIMVAGEALPPSSNLRLAEEEQG